MTPNEAGGSDRSSWRWLAAMLTLCGGLALGACTMALGACTQRDTNNPFAGPSGAATEMPYGPGVKTTGTAVDDRP